MVHYGLNFSNRSQVFLFCLHDDVGGCLLKNLLADEVLFALGFVIREVFRDQLIADLHILGDRHVELLSHG